MQDLFQIVSKYSISVKRLSSKITKKARSSVIQETLRALLKPLDNNERLYVALPNGSTVAVTPFLSSIVADVPEDAVIKSLRFGMRTSYPRTRCFQTASDFSTNISEKQSNVERKACSILKDAQQSIEKLHTENVRNKYLKKLSLREPKSFLLDRFKCNLDHQPVQIEHTAFSLPGMIKFESMHDLDLGITADILREIVL